MNEYDYILEYWGKTYLLMFFQNIPIIVVSVFGGLVRAMHGRCNATFRDYVKDCLIGLFVGIMIFIVLPADMNKNLKLGICGLCSVCSKDVIHHFKIIIPKLLSAVFKIKNE